VGMDIAVGCPEREDMSPDPDVLKEGQAA